jgi:hypothetical protein
MTDPQRLISDERVRAWLESAEADADRRGLPDLKPVLRLFAQATVALRAADWNGITPPDNE